MYVCSASACVMTAGVETTADALRPLPVAFQQMAPSAVGGAYASVAGVCATTCRSMETGVRNVLPARVAANQTGIPSSAFRLHVVVDVVVVSSNSS